MKFIMKSILFIFLSSRTVTVILASLTSTNSSDDLKNSSTCTQTGCGFNAVCIVKHVDDNTTKPYCTCRRGGYFGDPNIGCITECESGADCGGSKICSRKECIDACPGFCGDNAKCEIKDYKPTCTCLPGYHGVPGHPCVPISQSLDTLKPFDPCEPNPCGRYAWCQRKTYNTFECVCIHQNGRTPPHCSNQCDVDTDCPLDKHCNRNWCQDAHGQPQRPSSSCDSDKCGQFTEKVIVGGRRVCKCLPGYYGHPPNCMPECTLDSDCPNQKSCYRSKCVDPCVGACHPRAICSVQNHTPVCVCPSDSALTASDPYKVCYLNPVVPSPFQTEIPNYCENVEGRCGPNANCTQEGNFATCTCLPGYTGSPPNCKKDCSQNSDCSGFKSCVDGKCINPCDAPSTCGPNSNCRMVNHEVQCSCGITDSSSLSCQPNDPCVPSPCATNATCEAGNGVGCCKCLPNYYGDPYTRCVFSCGQNTDCSLTTVCIKGDCVDPCSGTCGKNAICHVKNHSPVCTCPEELGGNPFISCDKE